MIGGCMVVNALSLYMAQTSLTFQPMNNDRVFKMYFYKILFKYQP